MGVRYEERQWLPWWVVALAAAIGAGSMLLLGAVFALLGSHGSMTGLWIEAVVMAVFLPLMTLWSRALIRLDDRELDVGRSASIPLEEITAIKALEGHDVSAVRSEFRGFGAGTGAGALASLVPGLGTGAVAGGMGVDILMNANARAGMRASVWQRQAILVVAPELATPLWLIGTRKPAELERALREAVSEARSRRGLPEPAVA